MRISYWLWEMRFWRRSGDIFGGALWTERARHREIQVDRKMGQTID
jgi:hypothetical protein